MKYIAYVTIRNSYEVEASSKCDAEMKVREMDSEEILKDSYFKIQEIEETKP
tara:strand:- start:5 stop:160 length:156 start_codon:yes stop_codon:yes gene_type:complete